MASPVAGGLSSLLSFVPAAVLQQGSVGDMSFTSHACNIPNLCMGRWLCLVRLLNLPRLLERGGCPFLAQSAC
ncbi:hypothetical protein BJX99DRAFT_216703 [Aspergillus californicus]